jgi:DinB family protein
MLSKDQFLDSMRQEIKIIKHLATKVPPGTWNWRPTPGQRSTLELLRYLTYCGTIGAIHAVTDNWDHAEAMEKAAESVTPENFAAAMDKQMAALESLIRPLSDAELAEKPTTMPWGAPTKVGIGLVDMGLKPLVAYRMQFFLYAKQSGNAEIGSAECWVGMSPPKKA